MCLAIPMQIEAIDGFTASCQAKGVYRDASLFMQQHETFQVGDYVLVHLGYVTQKVSEEEAHLSWELYDQILKETGSPGYTQP